MGVRCAGRLEDAVGVAAFGSVSGTRYCHIPVARSSWLHRSTMTVALTDVKNSRALTKRAAASLRRPARRSICP